MQNYLQAQTEVVAVPKRRESGLELLRILAMVMIVCHHYAVHNLVQAESGTVTLRFITAFGGFGKLGVNIFILISGYFLCTEKFKLKKLIKLIFQISLFSFVLTLCFYLYHNPYAIGMRQVIRSLYIDRYWFAFVYLFLFALFPFINLVIFDINEKMHGFVLCVGFIFLAVLQRIGLSLDDVYSNLIWFIYVYMVGAYIRKYPKNVFLKKYRWMTLSIILTATQIIVHLLFGLNTLNVFSMTDPITMINSVLWLLAFKNFHFYSKMIDIAAAATFSIYLIHDNQYVRTFLWKKVFVSAEYFYTTDIVWHAFLSAGIVFTACLIIGILYNYTVSILFSRLLDKRLDRLQAYLANHLKLSPCND